MKKRKRGGKDCDYETERREGMKGQKEWR